MGDCSNRPRVDKRDLEETQKALFPIPSFFDNRTLSLDDDAMRTIVDLPPEQIEALDGYRKKEGISRAEAVRRAIASFLPPKPAKRYDFSKDPAFGSSKGCHKEEIDQLRRMREEWEE